MQNQSKRIFIGLRAKSVIFSLAVMATLAMISGVYLTNYSERLVSREAFERMDTIGRTFSVNAEYGVLTRDEKFLDGIVEGIFKEKDILAGLVVTTDGQLLSGKAVDKDQRSLSYIQDHAWEGIQSAKMYSQEVLSQWGKVHVRSYPIYSVFANDIQELGLFEETGEELEQKIGYVTIVFSTERIRGEVKRGQSETFLMISIFMFAILILIFFMVTFFVGHLKRLLLATQKVGEGGIPEVIRISTGDEMERLAEAFNTMTHDLKKTTVSRDALLTEVEERKKTEEELLRAKKEAEIANRLKSEFLASMSHEIRTPMNAILGMSELLWEAKLPVEQHDYVRIIRNAGTTLLNLINDILDLSKVEAGYLELESVEFNLRELIEKTAEIMAIKAHEKGLEMISQVASDVPVIFIGDPYRLRQVLINLIGNAVKFTEKGEVLVSVEQDPGNRRPGALLFQIKDTGIGIPSEKIEAIFESFTQVDSSTTRKYGGTGLGLTISRKLVELMGGRISAESELGSGTILSFTVQLGVPGEPRMESQKEIQTSLPEDFSGFRVLIIDDNETNRQILHLTLSSWGFDVTEARSGQEALEILQKAADKGHRYHLLLLDRLMPGMDGFEAAERIKERFGPDGIVFMMITSDRRAGDVARAKELGIETCLVKPVQQASLREAIMQAMRSVTMPEQEKEPAESVPQGKRIPQKSILVVEDNPDNQFLVKSFLKEGNYEIDTADNGAQGVEKVKEKKYDLILMDLQMPVMDGYTAVRAIRQWEESQKRKPEDRIPVIALTANAFREEEQKALDAGCDLRLTKPVSRAILLETIERYIRT
ncbi:MAG: response regulator [Candidatus Omnitrophica bacterium]|nr:response regulator [Candidatus Omnitrophota bacterium]